MVFMGIVFTPVIRIEATVNGMHGFLDDEGTLHTGESSAQDCNLDW
jgi:hypothetical protein